MNYHHMTLVQLKAARRELRAVKKPRSKRKHALMLKTVELWIRKRK